MISLINVISTNLYADNVKKGNYMCVNTIFVIIKVLALWRELVKDP